MQGKCIFKKVVFDAVGLLITNALLCYVTCFSYGCLKINE